MRHLARLKLDRMCEGRNGFRRRLAGSKMAEWSKSVDINPGREKDATA